MWEVDPETRSKLLQIQKQQGSGNDRCCDCGAPSPQWASPKFSIFICLSCAGFHRGLGVHISFVRSISMDAFKQNEILRMQHGGNKAWQDFYTAHADTENDGKSFRECSIKERYESDVGDEWKERLTAKVEDRLFDRDGWKREREAYKAKIAASASSTITTTNSNNSTTTSSRSGTPQPQPFVTQKSKNEVYFSTLGTTNASRPPNLPPSQGGRYAGFGNSNSSASPSPPPPSTTNNPLDLPTDPLATLSKSFGWLTTSVARTAKTVNDTYIQPTAKNIAASDLAAQARATALQAGNNLQAGAKVAGERLGRFVEGQDSHHQHQQERPEGAGPDGGDGGRENGRGRVEPERKDFWDSFGEPTTATAEMDNKQKKTGSSAGGGSSIGTAAMKKNKDPAVGAPSSTDASLVSSGPPPPGKANKDDGWEDW